MKCQFVGTCNNVFKTERGDTFYTFSDLETGGENKVIVHGEVPGIMNGVTVKANLEVTGRRAKDGGTNYTYLSGSFNPAKVTIE